VTDTGAGADPGAASAARGNGGGSGGDGPSGDRAGSPGPRGRDAATPAQIPAGGWRDILVRLYVKFFADRAMLVAGGVTFYLLLALFPALAVFVSLFGLVADPAAISRQTETIEELLPDAAAEIIIRELMDLAGQDQATLGIGLVVSVLVALWTANNGMKAFFEALNIAYSEQEKRSFVRLHLTTFAFTLGGMLLAVLLVAMVGIVPAVLAFVDLGPATDLAIRVLRWALLLPVIMAVIALLYRYGPSREPAKWRWVTWGSAIATLVWLCASIGYSVYLQSFADYQATYGSLGALIGFLLWVWLSVLILVVGAELNAEMELQTRRDTTTPPEQAMGARGAFVADTVGAGADAPARGIQT
jgi:membrane protein